MLGGGTLEEVGSDEVLRAASMLELTSTKNRKKPELAFSLMGRCSQEVESLGETGSTCFPLTLQVGPKHCTSGMGRWRPAQSLWSTGSQGLAGYRLMDASPRDLALDGDPNPNSNLDHY